MISSIKNRDYLLTDCVGIATGEFVAILINMKIRKLQKKKQF